MADLETLGRRAVACAGWRWMPGMAAKGQRGALWRIYMGSGGVLCAQGEGDAGGYAAGWSNEWAEILGALPDLSDPATLGWLLALVREKWGPLSCVGWDGKRWIVLDHMAATTDDGRAPIATGDTEAEALVAALEVQNG
jgi:hypothetical protein